MDKFTIDRVISPVPPPDRVTLEMDRATAKALHQLLGHLSKGDGQQIHISPVVQHHEIRPHTDAIYYGLSKV